MFVSRDVMELGETVAAALLGVDRLYRAGLASRESAQEDSLAGEGLVAVNLSTIAPTSYDDWDAAAAEWETIRQRAGQLTDPSRCAYYEDLATSILSIIGWAQQGGPHPQGEAFEHLGKRMLGLERLRFTDEEWTRANDRLLRRLVQAGHSGSSLEESLRSWETSTHVPKDEVLAVLGELLVISRSWVEERMFPVSPDRTMRAVGVHDVSYSAYCDFEGGEMQVNLDQSYTIGELRHLVAHEAYPGHTTHLAAREVAAKAEEAAADVLLVVTDTPTSTVFEGIGDNGMSFCWDELPDDCLAMDVFRMRILAVCRAAIRWAAGEDPASVRNHLQIESHGDPAWVEQRMRFLGLPLRRPFIFAYAWGERVVGDVYRGLASGDKQEFFHALYKHHHSPRSLRGLTRRGHR